jgi:hypothetical protein
MIIDLRDVGNKMKIKIYSETYLNPTPFYSETCLNSTPFYSETYLTPTPFYSEVSL